MANETDKTAAEVKPEEEMNEEELKALKDDEDFIADFTEEDKNDPEKVTQFNEAMARSAKTTVAQKRYYRQKFIDSKGSTGASGPTGPVAPTVTAKDKADEKKVDPQEATDFRLDHPELTKVQQLKVIAHAGAYGITPEEALKDDLIVQFIKSGNDKADVEDASHTGSRSATSGASTRNWSNASEAEIAAQRTAIMRGTAK